MMSRHFPAWRLLLSISLLLVLTISQFVDVGARSVQGETYYVATTGTDGPGCGTVAAPCRTIQYAADLVSAGDTVLIDPGTYAGGITVETTGTETEPITFRADGGTVIINGSAGNPWNDAFVITEVEYILLDGLTIQNSGDDGVFIAESDHVTVRNCTFANNTNRGIFTGFSDYTTIENCESYGAVEEHGIYISNSSDYPIIRGNHIHDNYANGLHMNGDPSMGGDGIISYALVEDNVIYDNGTGGGSGINMASVSDSIVRNNLLYDNHASGISIYQSHEVGSQNNRVLNNTILMAADGRWAINIPEAYSGTPNSHNQVFNNILYNYHPWRGVLFVAPTAQVGFQSDYNVVMDRFSGTDDGHTITLAEWRQDFGFDLHSITTTMPAELFVDLPGDDYHLKPGSPAIDRGILLGDVTDDLEGNPRPMGTTHDAGAYEYAGASFSMTVEPASRRILPRQVATYTLSLQPSVDFTATVDLAVVSPSPDLVVSVSPSLVDPPGQATLTITDTHTGPLSPVVSYTIPITGTGDGVTRTLGVNLRVGDNGAPAMPSAPDPAHNAVEVSTSQVLSWQGGDPDGDPVTYTVAFGTGSPPPPVATTAQAQYAPSLDPETLYYWQITATDGISETVGPVWQFTTLTETRVYLPLVLRSWSGAPPQIAGCNIFPADHIWNTPIDDLPVDARSSVYINAIGANTDLHPDFGSGTWNGFPIGIPFTTVPGTQPGMNVSFTYAGESDPGPYPIPPNPPIEGDPDGNGDRHILIVDRDDCVLYELFAAHLESDGWHAGSGAIFDLNAYALRPDTWTSADAAGLPILPGLMRYDEVASGEIRHAIRFTANSTFDGYVWPARHEASSLPCSSYPPMGQRFRLKSDFDISGFSPDMQVILQAMKTYGIILADNGSSWFISGVPDERWDNDVLRELGQVHGHDFEAVDVSSLMVDPDSGQTQP